MYTDLLDYIKVQMKTKKRWVQTYFAILLFAGAAKLYEIGKSLVKVPTCLQLGSIKFTRRIGRQRLFGYLKGQRRCRRSTANWSRRNAHVSITAFNLFLFIFI